MIASSAAARSASASSLARTLVRRHPAAIVSLSSASSEAPPSSQQQQQQQPIVELREYELIPSKAIDFVRTVSASSELLTSLTPLRLFSLPETGGKLHVATHLYHYAGGYDERNAGRTAMSTNDEWTAYVGEIRSCMQRQRSTIFVEAPLVRQTEGVCGLAVGEAERALRMGNNGLDDCIFELRRYKLQLGYDTVPNFLDLYGEGLPSKLSAEGTDPTTSLITVLYTEVGTLNEVIELWRHGGGTKAMERSRIAARGAMEWRRAIGSIAALAMEFTNTIHKPCSFSPMR